MAANRILLFHPEPRWCSRTRLGQAALPTALRDWLFDSGSLTRRLRQHCPGSFRVAVLHQGWARPLAGEIRPLGLTPQHRVWIREVHLFCADQPWVFARTVIPPATLSGRGRRLLRLGSRPLGDLLFATPVSQRGEVQVARISAAHLLHGRAFGQLTEAPQAIWGRRSLFRLADRPLLVCEIFLPALAAHCAGMTRSATSS